MGTGSSGGFSPGQVIADSPEAQQFVRARGRRATRMSGSGCSVAHYLEVPPSFAGGHCHASSVFDSSPPLAASEPASRKRLGSSTVLPSGASRHWIKREAAPRTALRSNTILQAGRRPRAGAKRLAGCIFEQFCWRSELAPPTRTTT